MFETILLALFDAGDHCAPVSSPYPARLILVGNGRGVVYGSNGLFVSDGGVLVHEVIVDGRHSSDFVPFQYDFRFFNKGQRAASEASAVALQGVLERITGAVALDALALVPAVVGVLQQGQLGLYHYVQQAESGAIFVNYVRQAYPDVPAADHWEPVQAALASAYPKLAQAWPLLNDDCWYTKWLPAMEIERKFTFAGIPDTWCLINRLYDEVLDGRLIGFVPELDRDFQVFDYESHIFDVLGADEERGYISFIPQANGLMTIKRKWFTENTEIRRETVTGNVDLSLNAIREHIATMTSAPVKRLPVFRRKRFDVNFESLDTGNIFGVYFDICRTEQPAHAFAQCEVEYCRTRTFDELRDVMKEFESVADYIRHFLLRQEVAFQHDTFSKLDFVRDAAYKLTA